MCNTVPVLGLQHGRVTAGCSRLSHGSESIGGTEPQAAGLGLLVGLRLGRVQTRRRASHGDCAGPGQGQEWTIGS